MMNRFGYDGWEVENGADEEWAVATQWKKRALHAGEMLGRVVSLLSLLDWSTQTAHLSERAARFARNGMVYQR